MRIKNNSEERISKREAFAMAAMQGLCADGAGKDLYANQIAEMSVQIADALLKQLEE